MEIKGAGLQEEGRGRDENRDWEEGMEEDRDYGWNGQKNYYGMNEKREEGIERRLWEGWNKGGTEQTDSMHRGSEGAERERRPLDGVTVTVTAVFTARPAAADRSAS